MQILFNLSPVTVKVQIAPPIGLAEIGSTDTAAIHSFVLSRLHTLLQHPLVGAGVGGL
jgi:hypothetical protein